MPTIYVLTWRYPDNSGHGVVRAFVDENDALRMKELLTEHSDRLFEVVEVTMESAT